MSTEENFGAELPEELKSLEAALRQLSPRSAQLERDRIMYLAGQASARSKDDSKVPSTTGHSVPKHGRNWWPMATAALVLFSIAMNGLIWRATRATQRVVYVETPSAANPDQAQNVWASTKFVSYEHANSPVAKPADYFQLRNLVLKHGVDAMPKSETSRSLEMKNGPSTWKSLFQQLPGDDS